MSRAFTRLAVAGLVMSLLVGCGTKAEDDVRGTGPTADATSSATARSLAALVLRHVEPDATYAFPGDVAGKFPGLVSTAVWFNGRPNDFESGPDVVEVFVVPAPSKLADLLLEWASDRPARQLADGSTMYFKTAKPRPDWDERAGTTSNVDIIVLRDGEAIQVIYHGNAIQADGPSPSGYVDVESLKAIATDPDLGLLTTADLVSEGDAISVWRD